MNLYVITPDLAVCDVNGEIMITAWDVNGMVQVDLSPEQALTLTTALRDLVRLQKPSEHADARE